MNELSARLTGTVTLRTNHADAELQGPFRRNLEWPLDFRDQRMTVDAGRFPKTKVPVQTQAGEKKIVITRKSGGIGSHAPDTGAMEIRIALRVDYYLGFADLPLVVTTGQTGPFGDTAPHGSPVDAASGKVTLVAVANFEDAPGARLDGVACSIVVEGEIVPNPRV
jgi:hypothetical protein